MTCWSEDEGGASGKDQDILCCLLGVSLRDRCVMRQLGVKLNLMSGVLIKARLHKETRWLS